MPAPHIRTFRDGKTLEGELAAAMHRVGALGVTYPEHYYETLVAKYKKDSVPYPHILTILGEPRIKGHFFYSEYSCAPARSSITAAGRATISGSFSGTAFPGRRSPALTSPGEHRSRL